MVSSSSGRVLLYNGLGTAWASASASPSIGLMSLSAYLRENGYETLLLSDDMSDDALADMLADAKGVGFSVLTGNGINLSLRMSKRIRDFSPNTPIIWGGYHPTLEPEQTIRNELVDFVIRGEGEHTFHELLCTLEKEGGDLSSIPGLSYKLGVKIIHNPDRAASNLEDFPLPDYELYRGCFSGAELPYVSSRGCPFLCRFCCNAALNRSSGLRFRQLSMPRVLQDLSELCQTYSPEMITFWDDMFLSSPKRAESFLHGYKENSFSFLWRAFTRCDVINRMDADLLSRLKKIGLAEVLLGVESGSNRMLQYLDKRLQSEDVVSAVSRLASAGINVNCSFINGFPGETVTDVTASLDLFDRIKELVPSATIQFFIYTPLPGAAIISDCIDEGYTPPKALSDWQNFEFHAFSPPWLDARHLRMIRNISYASMFECMRPERLNSFREFVVLLFSVLSSIRLKSRWLAFAPELHFMYMFHANRLKRSE